MQIETVKINGDCFLVNGKISVPNDPKNKDYIKIQSWVDNGGVVSPEFSDEEKKQNKIISIKSEANTRILAAYPEWKQRNHMAAAVDIQNKELIAIKAGNGYTLSDEEMAVVVAAKAAKTAIFNIRSKSDQLESSLDSMSQDQLEAFNPNDDSNWS